MDNSEEKNLNLTVVRMCGLTLVPILWTTIYSMYIMAINFAKYIEYFKILDSSDLKTSFVTTTTQLSWSSLCIYLLFFGKAAASILQYFMAKWPLEYHTNTLAFMIRIFGLTLLTEMAIDILQFAVLLIGGYDKMSDMNYIGVILLFSLMFAFIYYLLFRGIILIRILNKLIPINADWATIAIRTCGVYLLPTAIISTNKMIVLLIFYRQNIEINAMYPFDSDSNLSFAMQLMSVVSNFNYLWDITLTLYLLFGGKTAAKIIRYLIGKFQESVRECPAAYFIRVLGLFVVIIQIKRIINLLYTMINENRIHELFNKFNLSNLLNLSCLDSLIMIIACLAIAWYLLNHGKLLLGFLNRTR